MTRQVLVTGSNSGIGRASVSLMRALGHTVFGVDLRDADFCFDLSEPKGRAQLISAVGDAVSHLDAVVAAAGILEAPPAQVISVNFFGVVDVLTGLRALLARSGSPRALVLSSAASRLPADSGVIEACLRGDEQEAAARAAASDVQAYSTSKAALARWVRRHAVTANWGGAGILLNALAPGTIGDTGMTRPMLAVPGGVERLQKLVPSAIGRFGTSDDMARLIAFLVGPDNGYIVGQVLFADGGCDALQRGDEVW